MPINQELLTSIQCNDFKKQTLSLDKKELTDKDILLLVKVLKHNSYIKNLNLKFNFISSLGAQSLATISFLEELDVSKNNIGPKGTIALAKNNLQKINISNNPIGKGITAFAASPSLVELNASSCSNFTDKEVKQLLLSQSLKKLVLSNNGLSGKCLKNIASNTTLTWLELAQNAIEAKYCRYITKNDTLETLNLSKNFIEDEGAEALSKNASLEFLELNGNQITEKGANALANSPSLLHLNLKDNPCNSLNVADLKKHFESEEENVYTRGEWERLLIAIQYNHFKEQALDLDYQDLTEQDAILLVKALKYNHYIKNLKLQTNLISSLAAQSLAMLTHLESLDVSGNNIDPDGAIALATSHFKTLNISSNPIGEGIAAFAKSPLLVELHASNCSNFTDAQVKQLFLSQSLKKLILSNNGLSGQCLENITSNTTLEWLNLSQNKVKGKYCRHITQINTLKTLNLSENPISNEGAILLAHSYSLKNVRLAQCLIGDAGAVVLSKNTSFEFLGLSGNQITEKGANALANSPSLLYLNLKDNPCNSSNVENLKKHFKSEEEPVYTRGEWERLLSTIQYNHFKEQALDLDYENLTEQDIIVLVEALKYNNYINSLKLQANLISSLAVQSLATLTHLESLDISGNNIGPNEAIALAKSNFKIINLSNNPIGEVITAFAKNPLLIELNASNCLNFTDAQVKPLLSSQSLKKLILSNNELSGQCLEDLIFNTTLEWLDLSQNQVKGKYCSYITQINTLKTLNLSDNPIRNKGAILLAHSYSLKKVLLERCFIGDAGADALSKNAILEFLGLSGNQITEKGANALANSLSLLHLNLKDNPGNFSNAADLKEHFKSEEESVYTRGEWEKLLTAIQYNHFKEQALDLDYQDLTEQDTILLVEALKDNNYIKSFKLQTNFISSLAAQSLATLTHLESLDVSGNNIGPDGATALATSYFKTLNISSNPIGEGIAAFARSPLLVEFNASACLNFTDAEVKRLLLSQSLKKLNLSNNGLSGQCLEDLFFNTTLEWLDLSQNKVKGKYCRHITQMNTLKTLNLSDNRIKNEGAILLANNYSLKNVLLARCFIGNEGADALSKNTSLKFLELSSNQITEKGANALANNIKLLYLNLKNNHFSNITNLNKYFKLEEENVYTRGKWEKLLTAIRYNHLKKQALDLDYQELTEQNIIVLVEALKVNNYINSLKLQTTLISSLAAQSLATLTHLESLDVSGNNIGPDGAIVLAKNNFKTLNISSNPIGEGIAAFAGSPLLVEFNASNCSNFTDAEVKPLFSSQSLNKLILSNNELSGQCLEDLFFNTTLEWLDLSQNKVKRKYCRYITRMNTLKTLNLSDNRIKNEGAILLANNSSLKNVLLARCFIGDEGADVLSKNTSLKFLELSGNQITEKGTNALANNIKLLYLNLKDNPSDFSNITNLNKYFKLEEENVYTRGKWEKLLTAIRYNHLKKQALDLDYQELTEQNIIVLVEALKYNNYINSLKLQTTLISSLAAQSLATLTHLESLDVSGNNIGPDGAIALAKSHFKTLNISSNPIGEGITAFAKSHLLVELDASNCSNFTDAEVKPLFSSQSLNKLILSNNGLSGQCLEDIGSNTTLKWLDLVQNMIEAKYCHHIAQNNTLKILNLSNNFIGDEGATLLAKNHSLVDLFLAQCFIGDKGAIALSQNDYFQLSMDRFQFLGISDNKITEKGARALANNFTFCYLNLRGNSFNPLDVIELGKFYTSKEENIYTRTKCERTLAAIRYNHFKKQTLSLNHRVTNENFFLLVKAISHNNHINELKLKNNYLSSLEAQSLATLNNLKSLNVKENKIGSDGAIALAKSYLRTLDISKNPIGKGIAAFAESILLVTLTVTHCPNLTDNKVKRIFLNRSLKKLDLSNNGLSGQCLESIISNTTLEWLNLSQNKLEGKYCYYIAQNNALKTLNLSANVIQDKGATLLARNSALSLLNLTNCSIGDRGAFALSKNSHFKELILDHNQITEQGASTLASNLTLSTLSLQCNSFELLNIVNVNKNYQTKKEKAPIETENIETLLKRAFNSNLAQELLILNRIQRNHFKESVLCLDYKKLTDEDIIILVEALKHNHYIKELHLEGNSISSQGAQALATLTHLETLNVEGNNIGPEGAIALAKSHLKTLFITSNPIGDSVAVFATSSLLTRLEANGCNHITNTGIEQLLLSKSIKGLDLICSQITDKCLKDIASNTILENLDLSQTNIKGKDCCDYIAQNNSLKWVNLCYLPIDDEGAIALAKSRSLKALFLTNCSIADQGAIALSKNSHLKRLSLEKNAVTEIGANALANNTTLTHLYLTGNPFNSLNVTDLEKFYKKEYSEVYTRKKKKLNLY